MVKEYCKPYEVSERHRWSVGLKDGIFNDDDEQLFAALFLKVLFGPVEADLAQRVSWCCCTFCDFFSCLMRGEVFHP